MGKMGNVPRSPCALTCPADPPPTPLLLLGAFPASKGRGVYLGGVLVVPSAKDITAKLALKVNKASREDALISNTTRTMDL